MLPTQSDKEPKEPLTENESIVYGAMQGMFNAKPDLVITFDNKLFVFEAKFTESFDETQLKRTQNIADVWSRLLFTDFGFPSPPEVSVIKLGAKKFEPNISWADILSIAHETYNENDLTLISLRNGVKLLKELKME